MNIMNSSTTTFKNADYKKYLLPKRLLFFDLDGTIIPSTEASGRRIAISISTYAQVRAFAEAFFKIADLPNLNEIECSDWYRDNGGPQGLINRVLQNNSLPADVLDCLSFYFKGLFTRRLTQYLKDDLKYDSVPETHIDFLKSLVNKASMVIVSYRYQSQFDFLTSIEDLGLSTGGLFGSNNAFAVGAPGTSSDGSKARFVGRMWRQEIRAQRRLTSGIGKSFPPVVIGDSIRDIHFAVDIGGIFFGVSETGEDSHTTLVTEIKNRGNELNSRSRIFRSLADNKLQDRLREECEAYQATISSFNSEKRQIE